MLETFEESKECRLECNLYGDDLIWKGSYDHEDGEVKEGTRCQVNIQRKDHLCNFSLPVSSIDP